jgi:four helix bundle protein
MQTTSFRTFELALSFHQACTRIKAKAHVKDQLERASLSVVLNLQEGAGRPTKPDQKRFYGIAYASIRECQAILRVLQNEELFALADKIGAHAFRLLQSR